MPISASDPLIRLTDSVNLFPSGPTRLTIYRWAREGFRGIRLQTVAVGQTLFTSEEAVREFITETTAARERGVAST